MKDVYSEQLSSAEAARLSPVIPATTGEVRSVAIVGVIVGLISIALMYIFNVFVFGAVLCRDQALECSSAPNYAMITGMIIGAIAAVAMLTNRRVYRPLLVTLAATIALWGFHTLIAGWAWYWALLAGALLFGIAYSFFAVLSRIRSFVVAAVVIVIATIIVRMFM